MGRIRNKRRKRIVSARRRFYGTASAGVFARVSTQAIDAEADDTAIHRLAAEAAEQWTGTFNPRMMDVPAFVELYRNAL